MDQTNRPRFWLLTGMIMAVAAARVLAHPPNFTPVAAMALFGGATYSRRGAAFLVLLVTMLLSDVVLGFHDTMWAVYLSFAATVGLGFVLRKQRTPFKIAGASLAASTLFFIV